MRGLRRTLRPQRQLDQLLFAELLQITAIHPRMDSEIPPPRKGMGNYGVSALFSLNAEAVPLLPIPHFHRPQKV